MNDKNKVICGQEESLIVTNIDKQIDEKLRLLMQSNNLVNTSYEITATQNRLYYYCLYMAQKQKNGEYSCKVNVKELRELIGNRNSATISSIKQTFDVLQSTSIEFDKFVDKEKVECKYTLISGSEYYTVSQLFDIKFSERLYNHLMTYVSYAPINLNIMCKFKSFYSQRFYELFRLWSRFGKDIEKSFTVADLRFIAGVGDKYELYRNFKQRVILSSIDEINKYGNMKVSIVKEEKIGRKVNRVVFKIHDKEKKKYFEGTFRILDDGDKNVSKDRLDDKLFVLDKSKFNKEALEKMNLDFKDLDFTDTENLKILQESICITLNKFKVNKITEGVKGNYKYFKTVFNNKLQGVDNRYNYNKNKNSNRFNNGSSNDAIYKYGNKLEEHLIEMQKQKDAASFTNSNETITYEVSDELVRFLVDYYITNIEEISKEEKYTYENYFNELYYNLKDKDVEYILNVAKKYNVEYYLDNENNSYKLKVNE